MKKIIVALTISFVFLSIGCSAKQPIINHNYYGNPPLANPRAVVASEVTNTPVTAETEKKAVEATASVVVENIANAPSPVKKETGVFSVAEIERISEGNKNSSGKKGKKAGAQTAPEKKKGTPPNKTLEDRVTALEKSDWRQNRRLNEIETALDEIGWAVEKAHGLRNIEGFKIGPFAKGSAKLTPDMKTKIIALCKTYKTAMEGDEKGKSLILSLETFTDMDGGSDLNTKLAQKRAESINEVLKNELKDFVFEIKLLLIGETTSGYTKRNARRAMIRHEFKAPEVEEPIIETNNPA